MKARTASGRAAAAAIASPAARLDRFFSPRGVAVVGVSENKDRAGYQMFNKIRASLHPKGALMYAVNPRLSELDGQPVYPSVIEVPDPLDVVVIATADVEGALDDCCRRKVPFVLIFAAGFGETGAEGRMREEKLGRTARASGVRVIGPNTNVNFFEEFRAFDGPKIGVVTQSGHQGRAIVSYQEVGYAFAYWAPTGNELDVEACDFIDFFSERPEVGAIAAYIEGWKDAQKLRRAADKALRARKPIVLVKVGRTDRGDSFAQSHTAHLTGSDQVFEAFCRQFGIIRVDDLDEVALTCGLFTLLPSVTGDRLAIYSLSGGTAAHVADLAERAGLRLPRLTNETQTRLREWLPAYLRVDNPVDNGGAVILGGQNRAILEVVAQDPNVDLIVCPMVEALPGQNRILSRDLIDVRDAVGKPVIVIWRAPKTDEWFDLMAKARIPIFPSVTKFIEAFHRYTTWKRVAQSYRTPYPGGRRRGSRSGLEVTLPTAGGQLNEVEAKAILEQYGIRTPREEVCADVAAAVSAADRIGYPVVMKAISRRIAHKSEARLISLGVESSLDVRREWQRLRRCIKEVSTKGAFEGLLVAEQVEGGIEMILGISQDPQFGPIIAVGLGGTLAEVISDVQLAVLPLAPGQAAAMVSNLRGARLLNGYRGAPACDVSALVMAIEAVARLASEHGDRIQELDINPLNVRPDGQGAVALDALMILHPASDGLD